MFVESGASKFFISLFLAEGIILGSSILLLNYQYKFKAARFLTVLGANSVGWRSLMIVGKDFNGHYVFFVALILSVIYFKKSDRKFRWIAIAISMIGLPMGDILTYNKIFPLMEHQLGLPTLILDSVMLSSLVVIGVLIEKSYSEKHQIQLEIHSQNLESQVLIRTEELYKAKHEVELNSAARSQFIANTSHEIRTPLNGINGYLTLLEKNIQRLNQDNLEALKPKLISHVEKFNHSYDRLNSLLERLLEISQFSEQTPQPHPTNFDFSGMVKNLINSVQPNRVKEKGLSISLLAETKPITCYLDMTFCKEIVGSLLKNAIQFADNDSEIKCEVITENQKLLFKITNIGPGIPDLEQQKIFDPFFQSSLTDSKTGGTGLGLSFAQNYAKIQNGLIEIESNQAEPTCFRVTLPISLQEAPENRAAS